MSVSIRHSGTLRTLIHIPTGRTRLVGCCCTESGCFSRSSPITHAGTPRGWDRERWKRGRLVTRTTTLERYTNMQACININERSGTCCYRRFLGYESILAMGNHSDGQTCAIMAHCANNNNLKGKLRRMDRKSVAYANDQRTYGRWNYRIRQT